MHCCPMHTDLLTRRLLWRACSLSFRLLCVVWDLCFKFFCWIIAARSSFHCRGDTLIAVDAGLSTALSPSGGKTFEFLEIVHHSDVTVEAGKSRQRAGLLATFSTIDLNRNKNLDSQEFTRVFVRFPVSYCLQALHLGAYFSGPYLCCLHLHSSSETSHSSRLRTSTLMTLSVKRNSFV